MIITISFHYQVYYIQSEGLSFPLFIAAFFLLIECFQKFNLRKISYLAFAVSLLVLVRLQFYYLYGIFLLLTLWYLWQGTALKSVIAASIILITSAAVTLAIDHTYHYLKHGFWGGGTYGGLLVLVQPLYLANDKADNYFTDPMQKTYIQAMLAKRNTLHLNNDTKLLSSLKPSYFDYAYEEYVKNYLTLLSIITDTLQKDIKTPITIADKININNEALLLYHTLFIKEFKNNLLFLTWKLIRCIGGIPIFLFFLLILSVSFYNIIKNKIVTIDSSVSFIIVSIIITFSNAMMIALCNPDLPPYFCYSQFILYCLAGLLVSKASYKN